MVTSTPPLTGVIAKVSTSESAALPLIKELINCESNFNKVIGNPRKGYLEKVIDGAKSFNAKKKWINELKNWQK